MTPVYGITRPRHPALWLAAMAVGLSTLTAAGPALHLRLGDWALIAIFGLGAVGAYCAGRLGELSDQRQGLAVILIGAAAMRFALLFTEPTLSTDIYRYVWDGRVQAAGINPYRHTPAAPDLAFLRDEAIWPYINRADYAVTIYPPAAQMLFLAVTRAGESVVVMKLGMLLFEAAGVAAIIGALMRLELAPTRVAVYAWHPLPIWEIAGNGHVDAAMVALLMSSLVVFLHGRPILGAVLATLGALIKPTAALALPAFWRPWDWRLPLAVVVSVAVAYLPYLSVGAGVLGFLGTYIEEEGFRDGSGFRFVWLLEQIMGPMPAAGGVYATLAALALIFMALAVAFRSDRSPWAAVRGLNWLLIAFLVLSTPHYPWYFLALAPFLALCPTVTAWTLTTAGVLLHFVHDGAFVPGYATRFTILTLATLAAFAFDLWGEWRKALRPIGATP